MSRQAAIAAVARALPPPGTAGGPYVVTNLGRTADEWDAEGGSRSTSLYSMGMGLVTPVALGVALALPDSPVLALDGDGSLILGLGVLSTLGATPAERLTVVVLDNESYASTGTQRTATGAGTDLAQMAAAAGIGRAVRIDDPGSLDAALDEALHEPGPSVLVVKVESTAERQFVRRMHGRENTFRFVRAVEDATGRRILRPTARSQASPTTDRVTPSGLSGLASTILEGLAGSDVGLVASLPATQLDEIQRAAGRTPWLLHVGVGNEGEGAALCAGAWLGGVRGVLLAESSGLFVAAYALARCHATFGIPLVCITSYRGDLGESEWYAAGTGRGLEPLLEALGVRCTVVHDEESLATTIVRAHASADSTLTPQAVVLGRELTVRRRT